MRACARRLRPYHCCSLPLFLLVDPIADTLFSILSKSPYILFSISKMQEYKTSFKNVKVTSFSSQISKEWKELSPSERQKWKKMAEQDKHRYNVEKSQYTGPWIVSSQSIRKVLSRFVATVIDFVELPSAFDY